MDHAATTRMRKEVLDAMYPYLTEKYANASSSYQIGVENRNAIEEARKKVQETIGANLPEEIIFTSGGSEADNLAIKGVANARKKYGKHIITTKIEHSAVLNACRQLEENGFEVTYLDVDSSGLINLGELEKSIRRDTILISVMFVNNEIGTIEPIDEIGKIARKHHVPFHVDAVQAIGSIKTNVQKMNIDLLSMSAHKFYGPKGIGALYVREGIPVASLISGGHQEFSKRGGTENTPAIVGMGKAIEIANDRIDENATRISRLRDSFILEVQRVFPKCKLNGHLYKRHPGNVSITFENINAKSLVLLLSKEGIYCSGGSACNSFDTKPSHVLKAIGKTDLDANATLRFTFGEENTRDDIKIIIDQLKRWIENEKMV